MISFGPVPSRRLGKSLGINNILPGKTCSYSCVYCQVGLTKKYCALPRAFYEPEVIYNEVSGHLNKLSPENRPDYLSFVANGEPSLDIHLGKTIEMLKTLGIPIAVITNASLLINSEVRANLKLADWVSVKVDSGNKEAWKMVNRPHHLIEFEKYTEGLMLFSQEFKGKLVSETMLVKNINDKKEIVQQTAHLISKLRVSVSYIIVPTRPPAVKTVVSPDEIAINQAYQVFLENGLNAELVLGYEGSGAGYTGNAYEDIVNMCTVHPIRSETMQELLKNNHAGTDVLQALLDGQYIEAVKYEDKVFYIRKFHA